MTNIIWAGPLRSVVSRDEVFARAKYFLDRVIPVAVSEGTSRRFISCTASCTASPHVVQFALDRLLTIFLSNGDAFHYHLRRNATKSRWRTFCVFGLVLWASFCGLGMVY